MKAKAKWIPLFFACCSFTASETRLIAQNQEADSDHIQRHMVSPAVTRYLAASGDRLQKPGKERISATGTVSRNQGPATPIQITLEFPEKVRIDEAKGSAAFDAKDNRKSLPRDKDSADLIETLLEDSIDGFFAHHLGGSTRFLGAGYLPAGAARGTPGYELIEIYSESKARGKLGPSARQYWFDPRTRLLSRVVHPIGSTPATGYAEVLLNDWRDVQGAKIPFRIERKELGRSTFVLTLTTAGISPKANDGRFSGR